MVPMGSSPHGAGESSAVPLKFRAPGFAGHFGARIVPIRSLQLVAAYGSESA